MYMPVGGGKILLLSRSVSEKFLKKNPLAVLDLGIEKMLPGANRAYDIFCGLLAGSESLGSPVGYSS
jgi:hypothetical protein